jgi:hypothetical protein
LVSPWSLEVIMLWNMFLCNCDTTSVSSWGEHPSTGYTSGGPIMATNSNWRYDEFLCMGKTFCLACPGRKTTLSALTHSAWC